MNGGWGISYEIALRWMPQDLTDDKSTLVQARPNNSGIGSGNGLVPSGNKPLPEAMLTQICHHMASLGHNELILNFVKFQICKEFSPWGNCGLCSLSENLHYSLLVCEQGTPPQSFVHCHAVEIPQDAMGKSCTKNVNSLRLSWHIFVSVDWAIIGPDNGLSPDWLQAIFWSSVGLKDP